MSSSRKTAAEHSENDAVSSYNTEANKIEQVKNKKEVVEYCAAEKTLKEKVKTSKVRDFIKAQKAKKSEEELKKMRADADVKAYENAKKKLSDYADKEHVKTYVQAQEVLNRQAATTEVAEAKRAATSEKLMKEANIDPITILPLPSRSSTIRTQNPPKYGKDKSKKKKTTKSSIDDIPFDPNPSSSGGEESTSSRRSSSSDSDHNKKRRGGSGDRSKLETGSSRAASAPQDNVPPQKARPKNYIPLKNSPQTEKKRHTK